MISAIFPLQPHLQNALIKLKPLQAQDFEILYKVASDPLIWEQHPSKDRYKREVFDIFFKGAMESGGAFLVMNKQTGEVIGSSRFYGYDPAKRSLTIGYTFLCRSAWGGGYNRALKYMMLHHAFQFVEEVLFHVGAVNVRSQKALEKLGAKKISEKEMAYFGESNHPNFIYRITKEEWERTAKE
jgi:RimJ/RimL family protein N-acetyltransferase